jgi:phosphoribosyl 1,2-cyclic phosphodiesterase
MNFTPIASSSHGNAYLIESEGVAPLLIECGIPMRQLQERLSFGLSRLAGCLVSHQHGDHAKAVKDMLKTSVDVYMSIETAEALEVSQHHRINILMAGDMAAVGEWLVLPCDLAHDVPTHGFFIQAPDGEKLLFIPDTAYIRNRFEGINILAIECNNMEEILSGNIVSGHMPASLGHRVRRSHMSLERVISMMKANDLSRCRAIWLLHLSDANSNEELMRRKVQETVGVPVYIAAA